MSRRIVETIDRLGGLCFKIHLGSPMRIVAVRIEHDIYTKEELVIFVEPVKPLIPFTATLPESKKQRLE
jgi:hypothetical protein